jgi:hypothetical protein
MAETCSLCDNTGYRPVDPQDRAAGVIPCDHRSKGTFQSAGEVFSGLAILEKLLTPKDRDIAGIIARRRGAPQAISIDEITRELVVQHKVGADSSSTPAGFQTLWERSIKDSVRRLRRAGMKVGACRGSRDGKKAVGYYIISTRQELSATVRPLLRQAIDELKTIEALTGRGMYTRELEGQERLFESGNRELATGNPSPTEAR